MCILFFFPSFNLCFNLDLFENLFSIDPSFAYTAVSSTQLMSWLLHRSYKKGSDSNRQYCAELLSILLQNNRGMSKKRQSVIADDT